jgi:hypothetical protein
VALGRQLVLSTTPLSKGLFKMSNPIERLNCILRQRVSRWVRVMLSFSQKVDNHLGAIKYCLCHYHLEVTAALPL